MRYIQLMIVDATKCEDELPHANYTVDGTMMCAYAEGKDACHGYQCRIQNYYPVIKSEKHKSS
jgi:hypothetical protein